MESKSKEVKKAVTVAASSDDEGHGVEVAPEKVEVKNMPDSDRGVEVISHKSMDETLLSIQSELDIGVKETADVGLIVSQDVNSMPMVSVTDGLNVSRT